MHDSGPEPIIVAGCAVLVLLENDGKTSHV